MHCNPVFENFPNNAVVENAIKMCKCGIKRCQAFGGIGEILYLFGKRIGISNKKATTTTKSLMTLHGCCIIFSPKYFEQYDGFYPNTYWYGEEIILSYLCNRKKLLVKYIDETSIIHNESKGTKFEYNNLIKRHLFYYTNLLKSTLELKKLIEMYESY